ncbi:MAG: hypothetical protein IJS12_00820 [Lachnospiraceae bacterium]|nr:hypothetical protein [Lachnospiraceae bacterium]
MEYELFKNEVSMIADVRCDYEVGWRAMEFYKNHYPAFKGWETKAQKPKDAYGLYCPEDSITFTADILTEIKSPVKKIVDNVAMVPQFGRDIRKWILEGDFDRHITKTELLPAVKAFAYVYYWTGNMMPVPENPMKLADRGTWRNKIMFLYGKKEESELEKSKWGKWRESLSCEALKTEFFLNDMFCNGDIKSFYNDNVKEEPAQVYFAKNHSTEEQKQWFVNNAKLIIQRSYRIINDIREDYNEEQIREICYLMKQVFREACGGDYFDQELY